MSESEKGEKMEEEKGVKGFLGPCWLTYAHATKRREKEKQNKKCKEMCPVSNSSNSTSSSSRKEVHKPEVG